jgi:hypothetical protein
MKKKNIISIIVSIAIIGFAIITIQKQSNSTIKNEFTIGDTSKISKIFLVNKQNQSVTLTKKANRWLMENGDEAISENVKTILKTMMYVEIRQPVSKSAYNTIIKQLATNSVKVEFFENTYYVDIFGIKLFPRVKKSKVIYVGSPTRNYRGTIMMIEGSNDIYVTYIPGFNGYLTERFSANTADWVNHRIFKIPIRSMVKVKVDFGLKPQQSYEIENIGNRKFNLISTKEKTTLAYDTTRVLEMLSAFKSINFEAILDQMPQKTLDSLENAIPIRTVTVTTIDQHIVRIRMYHRPNFTNKTDFDGKYFPYDMDRMYALIDNYNYPVTVQFFVVDPISRTLDFLLGKEKRKTDNMKGYQIGN